MTLGTKYREESPDTNKNGAVNSGWISVEIRANESATETILDYKSSDS